MIPIASTINGQPVAPRIKSLMRQLGDLINGEYYLVGGTINDFYYSKLFNYKDIDIVIKGTSKIAINQITGNLTKKGYKLSSQRTYYLKNTIPAYLYQANNGLLFLDIAFIDQPSIALGLFDASSIYSKYPAMICSDKYNCLRALKNKTFSLASSNFTNENPYMIMGHFVSLCAKYNASLIKPSQHQKIINQFNKHKIGYINNTPFRKDIYCSFIKHVLKSIIRADNRTNFTYELVRSNILFDIELSLHKSLSNLLTTKTGIDFLLSLKPTDSYIVLLKKLITLE